MMSGQHEGQVGLDHLSDFGHKGYVPSRLIHKPAAFALAVHRT